MTKANKKGLASAKAKKNKANLEQKHTYKTVFINGKQVRVKQPEMIDGITVDEFIRQNADVVFLHQNEMWEDI